MRDKAAVLTSDSTSFRKAQKYGSKLNFAYSKPKPVAKSIILSATMYLILQLLSSAKRFIYGKR